MVNGQSNRKKGVCLECPGSRQERALVRRNEYGHAIIELALVIPIILLIAISTLEFSRALRHAQLSAKLSSELARNSYRRCTNMEPLPSLLCLNNERAPLQQFGAALIEDTFTIVSIYTWDGAIFRRVAISPSEAAFAATAPFATRFTIPEGGGSGSGADPPGYLQGASIGGNIEEQVVRNHRAVVVAETFVPFQSVVNTLGRWAGLDEIVFYEAVVL